MYSFTLSLTVLSHSKLRTQSLKMEIKLKLTLFGGWSPQARMYSSFLWTRESWRTKETTNKKVSALQSSNLTCLTLIYLSTEVKCGWTTVSERKCEAATYSMKITANLNWSIANQDCSQGLKWWRTKKWGLKVSGELRSLFSGRSK